MQLAMLRGMSVTRMGDPKKLSVVGDDVEIIFSIKNMDITSDYVDEFLNYLESEMAKFGQELSKEKTFTCPMSAEYVQTFARFRLYIYKDQIMNIASEKPRTIEDPMQYLMARKRLMLSKMFRGYDNFAAMMMLLFETYHVTSFTIRGCDVVIRDSSVIYPPGSFGIKSDLSVLCAKIHFGNYMGVSGMRKARVKAEDVSCRKKFSSFHPSLVMHLLPAGSSSMGLCVPCMPIVLSDTLFIYTLSNCSNETRDLLLQMWAITKRLDYDFKVEMDDISVHIETKPSLEYTDIFPASVFHAVNVIREKAKSIDAGRLNAERLPNRIFSQGVSLERFTVREHRSREDMKWMRLLEGMCKLTSLMVPGRPSDLWVLGYSFSIERRYSVNQRGNASKWSMCVGSIFNM